MELSTLSPHELQVIKLISESRTNLGIAREMGLPLPTISSLIYRLRKRYHVISKAELGILYTQIAFANRAYDALINSGPAIKGDGSDLTRIGHWLIGFAQLPPSARIAAPREGLVQIPLDDDQPSLFEEE